MNSSNQWRLGLALCAALGLVDCSGSKGPAGPAGAPGPAGSANVIYSAWKPAVADWNNFTVDGSLNKTSFILAPEATRSVLDGGLVMVYFKFATDPLPLPYTSNAGGTVSTMWFQPAIETTEPVAYTTLAGGTTVNGGAAIPAAQQNRIRLFRFTQDNSASITVTTLGAFRYVIVPGGVAAAPMVQGPDGSLKPLDITNYEQVKQHYNLPD